MAKNWDDLRIFLAVARNGTLTSAGKQLGLAHSTISRRLATFESTLKTRLFDRLPGKFVLTDAGQSLYDVALQVESNFAEAERLLLSQDNKLSGPIRVSTPELMITGWISPYLQAFCELHPEIELQMLASSALMSLPRREMDIALRFTRKPPETAVGRKLMRIEAAVYGARSYLSTFPSLDDLNQLDWIGVQPVERDRDEAFLAKYLPNIKVRMRMSGLAQVFHMVKKGAGISRLPHIVGELDPDLERVPGLPVEYFLDLWILTHRDLRNNPRIRAFSGFISEKILQDRERYQIAID